jgi:hypothetical protein
VLGTPEAPAQEKAKILAKYMVEEIAPKYLKNDIPSGDFNKREIKQ